MRVSVFLALCLLNITARPLNSHFSLLSSVTTGNKTNNGRDGHGDNGNGIGLGNGGVGNGRGNGNAAHAPPTPAPTLTCPVVTWFGAESGVSCTDFCTSHGGTCTQSAFPCLTTQNQFTAVLADLGATPADCTAGITAGSSALDPAGYPSGGNVACEYGTGIGTCDGSQAGVFRLCPCQGATGGGGGGGGGCTQTNIVYANNEGLGAPCTASGPPLPGAIAEPANYVSPCMNNPGDLPGYNDVPGTYNSATVSCDYSGPPGSMGLAVSTYYSLANCQGTATVTVYPYRDRCLIDDAGYRWLYQCATVCQ